MGVERFGELMASDVVPLDEAALSISAELQQGLDVPEWLGTLDELAGRCVATSADGVVRHLFDAERFDGDRVNYYDWRNSCIDRVIATRTGIPISLSVVTIEVARRVGVGLVGIGMPTHFLVRSADDPDAFFDPFHGGVKLDSSGARRRFEAATSGQAEWDDSYLDPTPNRDIVVRMLNNLRSVCAGRGDRVRYGIVMGLRSTVPELADAEAAEIAASSAVFN